MKHYEVLGCPWYRSEGPKTHVIFTGPSCCQPPEKPSGSEYLGSGLMRSSLQKEIRRDVLNWVVQMETHVFSYLASWGAQ